MNNLYCPFCTMEECRIVREDHLTITVEDNFPISLGHTLIIPKRHIASFFSTTEEEQQALLKALREARILLNERYNPDGYNIGINDGLAAGQTIMHLHIHLIPRYRGDCKDPRGGIRWLFPDKVTYWE